ncbi:MAG TPA: ATP-binding protein, partial [Clostridia bacterium]|nr:ATP-binding protein [Clostridia bacterium]
ISALSDLLGSGQMPPARQVACYARFAALVLAAGGNWTGALFDRLIKDENVYVRALGMGAEPSPTLRRAVAAELETLQALGALAPVDLLPEAVTFPVAGWETEAMDFAAGYQARMAAIRETGYGIFADHHMFRVQGDALEPVLCPDPVDEDQLTGYERERAEVAANTLALLEGRPSANVLLYGDSGTGKSTCVKALANRFRDQGLRLVELRKDQLEAIPRLIERLSGNPLKFILFIDDLSFSAGNDQFSSLKAILEGSVSARTANMAIYATSNRRHLVRESFDDRDGSEVHLRDTLEEVSSLSERFGLTVTFLRPDKAVYLSIAGQYCRDMGLAFDEETVRAAEAFAISRGGRSARTAKQFAENLAVSARAGRMT